MFLSSSLSDTHAPWSFNIYSILFLLLIIVDKWKNFGLLYPSLIYSILDFCFHNCSSYSNTSTHYSLLSLFPKMSGPVVGLLASVYCTSFGRSKVCLFLLKMLPKVSLFQAISFSENCLSEATKSPSHFYSHSVQLKNPYAKSRWKEIWMAYDPTVYPHQISIWVTMGNSPSKSVRDDGCLQIGMSFSTLRYTNPYPTWQTSLFGHPTHDSTWIWARKSQID